jgi:hypothetical protein
MDDFYQRNLFIKKKFTFRENGIEIEFKDGDGDFSLSIDFDKIGPRKGTRVFSKKKKTILRIGLALALLTFIKGLVSIGTDQRAFFAAIATAAIIVIIFYGYYHFTLLKYYAIPITNGKHFQVLYNSPSNAAANQFIDDIYERRKNYLRSEYFNIDFENDRKKELNKMRWLFDEDIINESELEVVTAEINDSSNY